jgi:exodeoxyribonuclease-3
LISRFLLKNVHTGFDKSPRSHVCFFMIGFPLLLVAGEKGVNEERGIVMKIASFNANGVRARLPILTDWLEQEAPDVLCIQETKVQDKDFPTGAFDGLSYHGVFWGQKGFNGVAIFSKTPPEHISFGFHHKDSEEARLITAYIGDIPIVNTYVPQGTAPDSEQFHYKLQWFQDFRDYLSRHFEPTEPLLWTGDFNVAPEPIDVYDPEMLLGSIGYHPEEHEALAAVKSWGFVDVFRRHNPEQRAYTFWDYRIPRAFKRGLGWRVDHIWATQCLAEKSTGAWIDVGPRQLEKPSDHTFILAEFKL